MDTNETQNNYIESQDNFVSEIAQDLDDFVFISSLD